MILYENETPREKLGSKHVRHRPFAELAHEVVAIRSLTFSHGDERGDAIISSVADGTFFAKARRPRLRDSIAHNSDKHDGSNNPKVTR